MMSPLPDDILLDHARSGDELAFRALVERYESAVASVVIGMLGAGDDADDVGQDTFIRFHGAAQWVGWLWPYATMAYLLGRVAARDGG